MIVSLDLDTKISLHVKKKTGVSHNAHIWCYGKMSQESINVIDSNIYYKDIIDKFFGENDYEITNVVFSSSKPDNEEYEQIIIEESVILEDKPDTRVIIKVKRVDFSGDHIIKFIHIWFPGKCEKSGIESSIYGYLIRNKINNFFGSTDYELISFAYQKRPSNEDCYNIFIDTHQVIKRDDVKRENINLEELTITELINLKDRIDEIIFKKENNLSDEEYEFFLENEETVSVENIKETFNMLKKDKFYFKKRQIKEKIKELIN